MWRGVSNLQMREAFRWRKVEAARVLAQACLDEMAGPAMAANGDTTLVEFAARFLEDCQGQLKPSVLRGHCLNPIGQILSLVGKRSIARIDQDDVLDWPRGIALSAGTRNRVLAVLSSLMRHAELTEFPKFALMLSSCLVPRSLSLPKHRWQLSVPIEPSWI